MKRISLLLAMALILAVAVPAMAGPFSDVPATHWAYDALQKLSATGIITGYPDGTFKGKKTLTRYEIAVVTARILDNVAAERAMLAEKVDALEDGLTAGQAEDVIAIFKSLMAKDGNKVETPVAVESEHLSETQAEEVAGIVSALVLEFQFELEALGADIAALGERIDAVNARIDELQTVTFNGEYSVDYTKNVIDGTAYIDPFDRSGDEFTTDDDTFEHALDLGMVINKGAFNVDVNLSASSDVFGTWSVDDDDDYLPNVAERTGYDDDKSFTIDGFDATVTTDDVTVTIANGQELVLTDFLLGLNEEDDEVTYDGVVAQSGDNTYALVRYTEDLEEELTVAGFGDHDIPATYTHDGVDYVVIDMTNDEIKDPAKEDVVIAKLVKDIFAAKQDLGLLDTTAFVGLMVDANGQSKPDETDASDPEKDIEVDSVFAKDGHIIAGLESGYDVLGIDLDTSVAVSRTADETEDDKYNYGNMFRISGKRNIGNLELAAGFRKFDDFEALNDNIGDEDGYDVSAKLPVGPLTVNGEYTVVTDDETIINGGAELADWNALGFIINADYSKEMRNLDENKEADREKRNVEISKNLLGIELTTGYKYDQYTDYADDADKVYGEEVTEDVELEIIEDELYIYQYDNYGDKLTKDVWEADDQFNNVYANLAWDTFIPGLDVTADYTYELDDVDTKLSTHEYGVNYAMGILTAGLTHDRSDVDDIATTMNAGIAYSIITADVEKELEGDLTVTASVNPEEYNVFGFGIDTEANFKMVNDTDAINYDLGVEVNKSINALTLNGGYKYADHSINEKSDEELVGTMNKWTAGLSYALTDSISADLNYTNLKFEGIGYDEDAVVVDQMNEFDADYTAEKITGGFSFSF